MFGMEWFVSQSGRKIYRDLVFSLKYLRHTRTLVPVCTRTCHRHFDRRASDGAGEAARAARRRLPCHQAGQLFPRPPGTEPAGRRIALLETDAKRSAGF